MLGPGEMACWKHRFFVFWFFFEKILFTFIESNYVGILQCWAGSSQGYAQNSLQLGRTPLDMTKTISTCASSMSESWGLLTVHSQPGTFCPDIASFKLIAKKKKKKKNSPPKKERAHFSSASVPVYYFIRHSTYVLVKMNSCLTS